MVVITTPVSPVSVTRGGVSRTNPLESPVRPHQIRRINRSNQRKKEAAMTISPQVILFVLFMLTVVQATRIDEMRQHKRDHPSRRSRRQAHLHS